MKSDLCDIQVIYMRSTEKAVCVKGDNGVDVWIPKSQCEIETYDYVPRWGSVVTLTAPESVLLEKNLL